MRALPLILLATLLWGASADAQPTRPWSVDHNLGPRFSPGHIQPSLHKWYSLRHLSDTQIQPWYSAPAAAYAQEPYLRYVENLLEGSEIYDGLGRRLGRGWLVYRWTQEQAQPRGSVINKKRESSAVTPVAGFAGNRAYDRFFDQLVIVGDRSEGATYSLMVGDAIYTRFTPLTFYKPRFNGVRLDYANDRLQSTLLLSRPSNPNAKALSDATQLFGMRNQFQASGRLQLGFSYVNAHNSFTEAGLDDGNPLRGTLTSRQNQNPKKLWVRVRDDSPGRGDVGAALAGFDIVLTDTSGNVLRGSEIGFLPEGGGSGEQLTALDNSEIVLEYDLAELSFLERDAGALRRVGFELALANDYRIDVASDLQTDGERFNPEIVFLPVRRSPGNVEDKSNTEVVAFDYGLPTANEIIGFDWNLVNWGGLSVQGEWVSNRRYFRYPNPKLNSHSQSVAKSRAAYVQSVYNYLPFKLFFEAFAIDGDYATNFWLSDEDGLIRYKDPIPQLYEFVDDDDDLDGTPEWQRPFAGAWRPVVWPGFDENRDFLNDYNQNRNFLPDYQEPFLRYRVDRPEFLFGLDMNHNGTADRFENDLLPDYPYKPDHRGFNTYLRLAAGPGLYLSGGHQRMHLILGDGRTRSWYGLLTWTPYLKGNPLRLVLHGAQVRDTITDDLRQWVQTATTPGLLVDVADPLAAQNAFKTSAYADFDLRLGPGIRTLHRFKWDLLRQRGDGPFPGRRTSSFIGFVDKAEWSIPIGLGVLEPRYKSEYRRQRPFSRRLPAAASLQQTAILLWTQPLMAEGTSVGYFPRYGRQLFATELQTGLELTWFDLIEGAFPEANENFFGWALIAQITNRVAYQGYQLVSRVGLQLDERRFAGQADISSSLFFITINAGLGR